MRDFLWQLLGLVVLCGAFSSLTTAQTTYTVADLGTLPGGNSTKVAGINKSGQIVGTSAGHAFLWSNGVMTDLGTLGGGVSAAHAINDQGTVVGEASTVSGEMHAFVWNNGVMTDLGVPGETSAAHGINFRGDIVGVALAKNIRGGAVLWRNGQRRSIGDLGPSGSGSTAISINDKGQIVGVSSGFASNQGVVRAVTWPNGIISDLGTLGGLYSTANSINYQGVVVGWAETSDNSTVAFQWQSGQMSQLVSLSSTASGTQAAAINDSGQVVGSSVNLAGDMHAVLWIDGRIVDINSLIPQAAGVILTRATGVNKAGQIIAEQQSAAGGPIQAFLLTPQHH